MKYVLTLFAALCLAACQSPGSFPHSVAQIEKAKPTARKLTPASWTTDNGSKVLFMHTGELPMLNIRMTFAAGSTRDDGHPGLASLTSAMIGEGARGLDVNDIARGFENLGAQFSTSSYRDMGIIELQTLSRDKYRQPAIDLLTKVIGTPTFPQKSLDRIRTQQMQGLRAAKEVPGPQVSKAFFRTLYGDGPYGTPPDGTLESLPKIDRRQIRHFYDTYYAGGNAVIAMVGDISTDQAHALAERLSKALPKGPHAPDLPKAKTLTQRTVKHIDFDSEQTHILIGNQIIRQGNPDYIPLVVGNYVLGGGGFASILNEHVRQKRGYVYSIGSSVSPMAAAGPFTVSLQTANKNADKALGLSLKLIRDYVKNGPTKEQVQKAKDNITGSFALSTASNADIVGQLAAIGFYDLPLNYLSWYQKQVSQTTPAQIKAVFRKYLDPDHLAIVSIGPKQPNPELPKDMTKTSDAGAKK